MVMNYGTLISLIPVVLFFGFICGLGIYFILKRLKGDLEIMMPKTSFISSETIEGQVKLKAKKNIDSNKFAISLIKEKEVGSGKNRRWEEIFKEEHILERKRKYRPRYVNYYDFSIKIPEHLIDSIKPTKFLGLTFKPTIRWKLYARVDAEGIDLTAQKIIKISNSNNLLERR